MAIVKQGRRERVQTSLSITSGQHGLMPIRRTSWSALVSVLVVNAMLITACLVTSVSALAQSRGASYLSPFPEGDAYNVMVIGDDFSYGLHQGLADAFGDTPRLKLQPRPLHFSGVLRVNISNQVKRLEVALTESKISIVVMMVGARDAVSIRDKKGKRFGVATEVWNKEYARRIDQLMALFKKKSIAVYWLGMPVTSRLRRNESYRAMNDILRDRAFRNGLKFIDVYAEFGDAQERFSAYGPDLEGETRLLRDRDGIFFTDTGNRKLAHFVERKIRRDLKQAQQDRQIPLAGSVSEQARIHAGRATTRYEDDNTQRVGSALSDEQDVLAARATPALGEQKADHGKISMRLRNASGQEEEVILDILRPTISSSVISLITRKATPNKRAEVGDTLIDNIPYGITVMSSITPSSAAPGGRRRVLSPTQSPFFRVMVKGEALAPVVGRVDDFSWPKQGAAAN